MKKILSSITLIVLFCSKSILFAQVYEPPKDVEYGSKEDYAKYEKEVIKCIEFLESAPIDDQSNRIDANKFFISWLSGSPNVSVDILPYISNLTKVNKEFLVTFLGGWTKYVLESRDFNNKANGHLAGLRSIIRVYTENKSVHADEAIDELVSIEKDGKLNEWLQKKLEEK